MGGGKSRDETLACTRTHLSRFPGEGEVKVQSESAARPTVLPSVPPARVPGGTLQQSPTGTSTYLHRREGSTLRYP